MRRLFRSFKRSSLLTKIIILIGTSIILWFLMNVAIFGLMIYILSNPKYVEHAYWVNYYKSEDCVRPELLPNCFVYGPGTAYGMWKGESFTLEEVMKHNLTPQPFPFSNPSNPLKNYPHDPSGWTCFDVDARQEVQNFSQIIISTTSQTTHFQCWPK